MKRFFIFLLLNSISFCIRSQLDTIKFIDSLLRCMTVEEKIGQLIAFPVYSNRDEKYVMKIIDTIQTVQPGFLIYFQGTIKSHADIHNKIISLFKIPPFSSMDAEYGVGMRLKDAITLPRAMTLAATQDTMLTYQVAKAIGEQCKKLKIQINYAPVVDVNNNPLNPVIGNRSFGSDPNAVVLFARAYIDGLSSIGCYYVLKHFPGHGNTHEDSHKTLPEIKDNSQILTEIHLMPFQKLIQEGRDWGIMIGHLYVPAIDKKKHPSTLSSKIIQNLLIEKMGYRNLIFTDALTMKGILKNNKAGQIEVGCLLAGNDILLMPRNVYIALDSIKFAIQNNKLPEKLIDKKVRKILYYKLKSGLFSTNLRIDTTGLNNKINQTRFDTLKRLVYSKSITLLKNDSFVPINPTLRWAVISFYPDTFSIFHRELKKFLVFSNFSIIDTTSKKEKILETLKQKLKNIDALIIYLPRKLKENAIEQFYTTWLPLIYDLATLKPSILILTRNPYHVNYFDKINVFKAIVVSYERDSLVDWTIARNLSGIYPFEGKLPVFLNQQFKDGYGIRTNFFSNMLEDYFVKQDLNSNYLDSIDILVQKSIKDGVIPGCQVLIGWKNQIIYHKAFGKHTYEGNTTVSLEDLYDLASLTKILATTLAIMKLYEEGKITLEEPISTYLPELRNSSVGQTNIARILTHSAGFPPYIAFYKRTLEHKKPSSKYYTNSPDSLHSIEVAKDLFLLNSFSDSIKKILFSINLNPNQGMRYSDLGFIILAWIIERITQLPFDQYVYENFYRPLGLNYIGFNPKHWYPLERIVPTEIDTVFRKQLVHGYVHDQTAAMLGGIAGHAGLFANAYNVAVIMQMLLNKGSYRNVQFFKPETVMKFTNTFYDKNYKGLGFDKPNMRGNVTSFASPKSFGHFGFTGTFVWADPTHQLVFVFLSNRVYPSADNWKIRDTNLRGKLHEFAYKAILKD
ncbi:MAG: serine hydrolase [Bacteroidales bacterium]|nr:serine hydrolase [Bacteroidales bacterium]